MKLNQIIIAFAGLTAAGFMHANSVSSNIPLNMEIPKLCSINNTNTVVNVPVDASVVTANYSVTCNTGYSIDTTTDNYRSSNWSTHLSDGTRDLVTYIGTTGPNNTTVPIMIPTTFVGSSVDHFTMSVRLASPVTATQTAGTYTDNYRITVTY